MKPSKTLSTFLYCTCGALISALLILTAIRLLAACGISLQYPFFQRNECREVLSENLPPNDQTNQQTLRGILQSDRAARQLLALSAHCEVPSEPQPYLVVVMDTSASMNICRKADNERIRENTRALNNWRALLNQASSLSEPDATLSAELDAAAAHYVDMWQEITACDAAGDSSDESLRNWAIDGVNELADANSSTSLTLWNSTACDAVPQKIYPNSGASLDQAIAKIQWRSESALGAIIKELPEILPGTVGRQPLTPAHLVIVGDFVDSCGNLNMCELSTEAAAQLPHTTVQTMAVSEQGMLHVACIDDAFGRDEIPVDIQSMVDTTMAAFVPDDD